MTAPSASRELAFLCTAVLRLPEAWQRWGLDLTWPDAELMLGSAEEFATTVLQPLNAEGDRLGCALLNGQVRTPPGWAAAYQEFCALGFSGMAAPTAAGGQDLPHSVATALGEVFCRANLAFTLYYGLTQGAANLLLAHGNAWLRQHVAPRLVRGDWGGTMCLTEAQCGTDLGLVRTLAQPAGTSEQGERYRLTGSKLFISAGDHDLTENIVHLVLARLPDSRPGSRGLSLFAVPKWRWDATGAVTTHRNGVSVGRLEHKMGIRASATAVLDFEQAEGVLVGQPGQGLPAMFTMMNEARLSVALQGLAVNQQAADLAAAYVAERRATRSPWLAWQEPSQAADLIAGQPDVARMLQTQQVWAAGGRFLLLYLAHQLDVIRLEPDPQRKQAAADLVSLLTPVAKAFCTDNGIAAADLGIQALGGHGYIRDHGLEQLYRDARITAIYEGTNGVQALDLLGRKVFGAHGATLQALAGEVLQLIDQLEAQATFTDPCARLRAGLHELGELTGQLGAAAAADPAVVYAAATPYLRYLGLLVYGYALLRRAQAAAAGASPDLMASAHRDTEFFFGQLWPQTATLGALLRAPLQGLDSRRS